MKKFISALLTMVMVLSMISMPAMANKGITVTLDGKEIIFDVQPQLINDRTMVPLRAIFEALDAEVYWTQETQTVTSNKGNTVISMSINNPVMYVNGQSITLDTPPCIVDERTLVPVRAISEAFDLNVDWEQSTKTVVITSKVPDPTPEPTVAPTPKPTVAPSYTNSAFSVLKSFIITNGSYSSKYNSYTYILNRNDDFTIVSYSYNDDDISVSMGSETDSGSEFFYTLTINNNGDYPGASLSYTSYSSEYDTFFEYRNGNWRVFYSDAPNYLQEGYYDLMMTVISLFDTYLARYTPVSLADFGITYPLT